MASQPLDGRAEGLRRQREVEDAVVLRALRGGTAARARIRGSGLGLGLRLG